jgi:Arc/MetJ-type ribon-helix-helix transcriptional regulator
MIQLVTKVDDSMAMAVDELIANGQFASRSEAVRAGLSHVVEQSRRAATATAILAGYQRVPETDEELEQARLATIAMIEEEPW